MDTLYQPLFVIGMIQTLFVGLAFFFRKPRHSSDIVISALMAAFFIHISLKMVPHDLFTASGIQIFAIPLTFGPLLYLYTRIITQPQKGISKVDLIHFAAPCIVLVTSPLFLHTGIKIYPEHCGSPYVFIMINSSLIIYTTAIVRKLRKHKDQPLTWLKHITLSFAAANIFVAVIAIAIPPESRHPLIHPKIADVYALAFFTLVFANFARRKHETQERPAAEKDDEKKYSKSGLKFEEQEHIVEQLLTFISHDRPYLNPEITLDEISKSTSIPRHHITQAINGRLKKNFYTFINEFRVQQVINRMGEEEYREMPILRIAFDSGFNSKSVFNRVFKEITGSTPKDFRRQSLEQGDDVKIKAAEN